MITNIDFAVLDYIYENFRCEFLDKFFSVITLVGEHGILPIIIAAILLCIPKTRRIGISLGVAYILGGLIGNLILKNAVARIRPYDINTAVIMLVSPLHDYSFPSGHTLICFEMATVLMMKTKRCIGIPVMAVAVLVALSRLYLYVHYPSDVIVGIILGIAFGLIGAFVTDRIHKSDRIK